MQFFRRTYAFSHLRKIYTVTFSSYSQETINQKGMQHDIKQLEVVTFLNLFRSKVSRNLMIDSSLPIPNGNNMLQLFPISRQNKPCSLKKILQRKIKYKERKISSVSSPDPFRHSPPNPCEYLVCIFSEAQAVANPFYQTCFTTVQQSNKRKECISMNLWAAFTVNFFNWRGRRKDLTLY